MTAQMNREERRVSPTLPIILRGFHLLTVAAVT
jgi:hypothetical protein